MTTKTLQPALHRSQIQLDKLAHGSVVLDRHGDAWQLSREYWYRAYGDDSMVSSFELAQRGPITTIHKAVTYGGLPVSGDGFPKGASEYKYGRLQQLPDDDD